MSSETDNTAAPDKPKVDFKAMVRAAQEKMLAEGRLKTAIVVDEPEETSSEAPAVDIKARLDSFDYAREHLQPVVAAYDRSYILTIEDVRKRIHKKGEFMYIPNWRAHSTPEKIRRLLAGESYVIRGVDQNGVILFSGTAEVFAVAINLNPVIVYEKLAEEFKARTRLSHTPGVYANKNGGPTG